MEFAPWITPNKDDDRQYDTLQLPDDVVGQSFTLAVDSQAGPERRTGGHYVSLNYGGRVNPKDLSDDDKEHVLAVVRAALDWLPESGERILELEDNEERDDGEDT